MTSWLSQIFILALSSLALAEPPFVITLDPDSPESSHGSLTLPDANPITFPVGLGRKGTTPAGESFAPEKSLLGHFRINAILTNGDRFEIDPDLVKLSGKSELWLRTHLFANMSSIDFEGDGKGGEYGTTFLSLTPLNSTTTQPFRFHTYKGTFRWYSYALHGTQDESRIGKKSTGGCINLPQSALKKLLPHITLKTEVLIKEK